MKSERSPGKWWVDNGDIVSSHGIVAQTRDEMGRPYSPPRFHEDEPANAAVLGAAPDLLEVAEMAHIALSQLAAGVVVPTISTDARVAQLEKAIKKARYGSDD